MRLDHHVLPLIVASAMCAPTTVGADAACPADSIEAGCGWTVTSAPFAAVSSSCFIPSVAQNGAQYNLAQGTSRARAWTLNNVQLGASVRVRDVYTLVGPPSTDPHPLWVQLEVHYVLRSGIDFSHTFPGIGGGGVRLFSGDTSVSDAVEITPRTNTEVRRPVVLALTIVPNEPFVLGWSSYAWGRYDTFCNVDITLEFATIPSGYVVTSCQGFSSTTAEPVPTRSATWGRLKSLYR